MKVLAILLTAVALVPAVTFAAAPLKNCSNRGNSIEIIEGEESLVKIRIDDKKFVSIPTSQLNVRILSSRVLKPAADGCDSSKFLEAIRISYKNGRVLPHAYTQTAENGKLEDFFLCEESTDAIPQIDEDGKVFCY